eukprot:CAMPEP_0117483634 /NCGR_PEP_ID=MMETSP0784-20121206/14039_1 /TAXON_ID=39447 /ORGANISM="" /LENGTH=60 /DNA_ID=CAMNT_0005278173 /DNA_START=246 /DNA_END=425 /DNA_ORIENTATION=+
MAEEIREIMASLGIKTINELVGRADLLEPNHEVLEAVAPGLDLTALLQESSILNPGAGLT